MNSLSCLPLLACPETGTALECKENTLCNTQGTAYNITAGIPRLLQKTKSEEEEKVRQKMQAFYEEFTFPGYDNIDSAAVLIDKAKKSQFGAWINQAIPPMATVIEIGCGTGQMTNFLGLVQSRNVLGVDQSIASLTLGNRFKGKSNLKNVSFIQGNIFSLPIQKNCADVVICSGVLHHTPNPYLGFQKVLQHVKPGGYVVIGLYNSYARIPLGIRKRIFTHTGNAFRWLDYHMRRKDVDDHKKEIWFADQYKNPHESWHSVDEVLRWFDQNNVEFINAVPTITENAKQAELFKAQERGSSMQHVLQQLGWMFTIAKEGGLFVMIGKKV